MKSGRHCGELRGGKISCRHESVLINKKIEYNFGSRPNIQKGINCFFSNSRPSGLKCDSARFSIDRRGSPLSHVNSNARLARPRRKRQDRCTRSWRYA